MLHLPSNYDHASIWHRPYRLICCDPYFKCVHPAPVSVLVTCAAVSNSCHSPTPLHVLCSAALQSPEDMVVERVDLSSHILVLGIPASQESLIALLAAVRSKQLQAWRPVVIVDSDTPCKGGSWEAVAQFSDVYFVQVRDRCTDTYMYCLFGCCS